MTLQCFASNGTLHKTVWIATPARPVPSGISSSISLRMLGDPTAPRYHYYLYREGKYDYSVPEQTLVMAELFIGDTPLVFTHK